VAVTVGEALGVGVADAVGLPVGVAVVVSVGSEVEVGGGGVDVAGAVRVDVAAAVVGAAGLTVAVDSGDAVAVDVRADPPLPAQAARPNVSATTAIQLRSEIDTVEPPRGSHHAIETQPDWPATPQARHGSKRRRRGAIPGAAWSSRRDGRRSSA